MKKKRTFLCSNPDESKKHAFYSENYTQDECPECTYGAYPVSKEGEKFIKDNNLLSEL